MAFDFSKQVRADAITSLQRYSRENMIEPLGDLAAGLLLDFVLEEIGPLVYNKAIADAQAEILQRVGDLNGDLYAPEFPYWAKVDRKRKTRG